MRNVRTKQFRDLFAKLPANIQELAKDCFRKFLEDPSHPSLRLHKLEDSDKGQHRPKSISVSITMQYRVLFVQDGDTNVWYWIGTHNDYENFTGKK